MKNFAAAPEPTVLALNRNEYFFPHPASVVRACQPEVSDLGRYAPLEDQAALQDAVARHLNVPAERILLGHGAEDIAIKLLSWLRLRTAKLVHLDFSWQVYVNLASGLGYELTALPTPCVGSTYRTPLDRLDALLGAAVEPHVVLLVSPNNPTGHVTDASELGALALRHPRHIFIIDTVYDEPRSSHLEWVMQHPNAFLLGSFSKFFGLPGIRVGYAVGRDFPAGFRLTLGLQPWAVSGTLVALAEAATYRANREVMLAFARHLRERFSTGPLEVFHTESSFVLMRIRNGERAGALMEPCSLHAGVMPKMFEHGGELFLRWGLGPDEINARVETFLNRLVEDLTR